jgi:Rrf2 family protein
VRPSPLLRVTEELDQALLALRALASCGGATCDELAEATGVSAYSMSNVLQKLKRSLLVGRRTGCAGGYDLGRPATAIRVADVVAAVQGRWSADLVGAPDRDDPLGRLWGEVEEDLRRRLTSMTVADLCPARSVLAGSEAASG